MTTNVFRAGLRIDRRTTRLAFLILILMVLAAGCNLPSGQPAEEEAGEAEQLTDRAARTYQMYFDSSADPLQNELQVRRFVGQLHLADIEGLFGDPQSLPLDENCNYAGGPVVAEGLIWYVSLTTDLVGANLISVSPDGTTSSALDLDGDRVADIVDMRLGDNRRISFLSEELGLEVFELWLLGRDPLCQTELARQLGLPDFGCNDAAEGSPGGGGAGAAGGGIVDPLDLVCSEYDTGTRSQVLSRAPTRTEDRRLEYDFSEEVLDIAPGFRRNVETWIYYNTDTGELLYTRKLIVDTYLGDPPRIVQIISERAYPDGRGYRETFRYGPGGNSTRETEEFEAEFYPPDNPYGEDPDDYDETATDPPPDPPPPPSDTRDPGPDGDDSALADFCRRRANYRSGVEQAASTDPSAMNVGCNDLVGAPSGGDCTIIAWARPEDFQDALHPSPEDDGCDPLEQPGEDGFCEPTTIRERLRGMTAELWSLDLPDVTICPPIVCNPAQVPEARTYTSGQIEAPACPVISDLPGLEPSEENCPPGTYYAPVTNRCIEIQLPSGGSDGGDGDGGCNLSVSACSAQGLSFDSGKCECVPLQ